jgi:hypothetical protein
MSYRLNVLSNSPLAFWPLDSVSSSGLLTYQELLDDYSTYTQFLNGFDTYAESSGSTTPDISGSNNTGIYIGLLYEDAIPLVSGLAQSRKIKGSSSIFYPTLNDHTQPQSSVGFGTSNSSDNDFTLECWTYIDTSSTLDIPLIGDSSEDVGLFYSKGNIVFKLNSQEITWTIPYTKKALHIAATYSSGNAYLYIDGKMEVQKDLGNFAFSNTSLNLSSGPVNNSNDYMLINAVAIYRYSLSSQAIKNHYDSGKTIDSNQVVYPDGGELFNLYDNALSTKYSYSYPANRQWEDFLTSDLYYDNINNAIRIASGSGVAKTVILNDFITIPSGAEMDDSRIEWDGNNGITVQTSIDGINYQSCINGQAIPQYSLSSFSASRNLHIRITMTTSNNSLYLPKLYSLSMSFYNNQVFYANNSASYISPLQGDMGLSNNRYEILSRDARNGIALETGSAFSINTNTLTKSLEFFYTPSTINNGGLVKSISGSGYSASNFSWSSSVISKTNIDKIYVNGIDKSTQTDIHNIFAKDQMYHVVITFTNPISGQIDINYSTAGAISALYQNIAIYDYALTLAKSVEHFNLYLGNATVSLSNSLMSMTENSFNYYNYDWTVVQNI